MTLSIDAMSTARRATVYLDADLHRALRIEAAETDKSISDLVSAALRLHHAEGAEDLAAYREAYELCSEAGNRSGLLSAFRYSRERFRPSMRAGEQRASPAARWNALLGGR